MATKTTPVDAWGTYCDTLEGWLEGVLEELEYESFMIMIGVDDEKDERACELEKRLKAKDSRYRAVVLDISDKLHERLLVDIVVMKKLRMLGGPCFAKDGSILCHP